MNYHDIYIYTYTDTDVYIVIHMCDINLGYTNKDD